MSEILQFVDPFLPIGRTNFGFPKSPRTAEEALQIMDTYDVDRAFIYHTVSRDSAPEEGNGAIEQIENERFFRCWGFDPSFVIEESEEEYVTRALSKKAKAVLINPLMRNIALTKSPKILGISSLLQERRIPLFLLFWKTNPEDDVVPWYDVADFCNKFPRLPVYVWEWRSRSNRPLFDALALAENLRIPISSLWQAQMLDSIVQTFGDSRLVFSLGLPGLDPGSFQQCVRYADIPDESKRAIASGNILGAMEKADYSL